MAEIQKRMYLPSGLLMRTTLIGKSRSGASFYGCLLLALIVIVACEAQKTVSEQIPPAMVKAEEDRLWVIAREIADSAGTCAFITVDSNGVAAARTMDPFPPEDDFTIWLGTTRHSRKVSQVKNNQSVTLYYAFPNAGAYLTIIATAEMVDTPESKARYWKEAWAQFYPNREDYILIKVTPQQIEIISEKHGIVGNPKTWRATILNPGQN